MPSIKVTEATHKILSRYSKERGYPVDQCADELIDYANARLETLAAYTAKQAKQTKNPKPKAKKFSGNRLSSPGVRRGKETAA